MSNLKRDLGLIETVAISMGAMVGSGIFILPGVAYMNVGGASVVLAFLVGGLLTVPAALSAAELGTAIPEDGGSYLYVERGMGPLLGTIAGFGNWLMLNFKTALALVGGVPYFIYILPSIQSMNLFGFEPIVIIAVFLSIVFTIINVVSTESAGKMQNIIVGLMLIAIILLFVGSLSEVSSSSFNGLLESSGGSFIATTALVFISYAGVIKITSVAEEIEDPGRNIPLSIIISLAITTFIYVAITFITISTLDIVHLVENVPISEGGLASDGSGAIIAIVAEETIGQIGALIVVISAILALASTANSGILSASRYPFSMARDGLAPDRFKKINYRFGTPIYSVLSTGLIVIILVMFFPIASAARFGGAFQILVFMLVNACLIGFREGSVDYYDPDYTVPFYPYLQIFGILSGFVLLSKIGLMALFGAVIITIISILYYMLYVRYNVNDESAVKEGLRENINKKLSQDSVNLLIQDRHYRIMIVLQENYNDKVRDNMISIAKSIGSNKNISVDIVEVKKDIRTSLDERHADLSKKNPDWIDDDSLTYTEIKAQNKKEAIVDFATYNQSDFILHNYYPSTSRFSVIRSDLEWILEHSPCDVLLTKLDKIEELEKISVVSDKGFHNPSKVLIADSIGQFFDTKIDLLQVVGQNAPKTEIESIEEYHNNLVSSMNSDVESNIIQSKNKILALKDHTSESDLIISELDISTLRKRILGSASLEVVNSSDIPFILVYSEDYLDHSTLYRRLLMKYIFRGFNR